MKYMKLVSLLALAFMPLPVQAGNELSWQTKFDKEGRIIQNSDPAGRITHFMYAQTADGTLEKITRTSPDGTPVVWYYDKKGWPAGMTDRDGKTDYRYDSRGRLESVERKDSPVINYAYDTQDRVTDLKVGDFYHLRTSYDFLGRIEKIDTPAGAITYDYLTGQNMLARTLPNGVRTLWKHAFNGELQSITHIDKDNFILAEYKYSQGPDGRIHEIRESSPHGESSQRFQYDTMGRLVHAAGENNSDYRYEYDKLGNRLKALSSVKPPHESAFDWAGRLISAENNKPCQHDPAGNLTNVTVAGVNRDFRYHPDGRLAEARIGESATQYRYDGDGRLLARKNSQGETRFLAEPFSPVWQPLVINENNGTRSLVVWDGMSPVAIIRNGSPEFLLHDYLGSTRLVVDSSGMVIRRMDYDPFGTPVTTSAAGGLTPGFAGLFWDTDAQLYLTMARAYLPHLGRFLQPDPQKRIPSGSQESLSLFSYCGNDPVNLIDQDGRTAVPVNEGGWRNNERWGRVAPEGGKRDETQSDIKTKYCLSEINTNIEKYRQQHHQELQTLDGAHLIKARKYAFKQWAEKHHSDPLGVGPSFQEIKNVEVSSNLGDLNLDWLATLGQPRLEHTPKKTIYWTGKEFWFANRQEAPDLHSNLSAYPRSNWSAVKAAELLSSGKISAEEVLLPDKMSPTVSKASSDLDHFCAVQEKMPYLGFAYITRGNSGPSATWWNNFSSDLRNHWFDTTRAQETLAKYAESHLSNARGSGIAAGLTATGLDLVGGLIGGKPANQGQHSSANYAKTWSPSPIGGVYLGGASHALEGIGDLRGMEVDSNNANLVLVADSEGEIKMPPLRVDDVVTVFRSVYLHGQGPTITIDPASKDPEQSAMIIRHGEATEDTYVGWVLYQADRLMKSYTLGVDNITRKDMQSKVPGYQGVVDTMYFGGINSERHQKEGNWERFWIVPAEARRFEGPRRELTILDVPLKVNTQSMKWLKGELVDDLAGKSSPGAQDFTTWFTANYDAISQEQYLVPPPESDLTEPVPVFTELRRIALLTAIAEKLRDQSVPLPYWMRDYEVKKVPFEKTTPGMQVTRQNEKVQARIYGGVNLSPSSKEVKTFHQESLPDLKPTEQAGVDKGMKLAGALEKALNAKMDLAAAPPLTPESITSNGEKFQTVAMPGAGTLALGPCRLAEKDMVVTLSDGRAIELVRSANSFFNPTGPWGKGWALDLPRLETFKTPVSREKSSVSFTTGYELVTPLNSLYARFKQVRPVAELENAKIMTPDQDGLFYGLADANPKYLNTPTKTLILKDGRKWHFTPQGDLAAMEEGALRTVYERDGVGRVTRIVALLGGKKDAEIRLEYDDGLLSHIVGIGSAAKPEKPEAAISYQYDKSRRLIGVAATTGTVGYRYSGPWVEAITWLPADSEFKPGNMVELRTFAYNSQGQLVSEKQGDTVTRHEITADPDGLHITSSNAANQESKDSIRYDSRLRPVESTTADGVHVLWTYPEKGGVETTVTAPDQEKLTVRESADCRQRAMRIADGTERIVEYDAAGRMKAISENGRTLFQREWLPNGQPNHDSTEALTTSYQYDPQGQLTSVVEHPPGENGSLKHWLETKLDIQGRPIAIQDYRGLDTTIAYDDTGAMNSVVQKTPEGDFGYTIKRGEKGRIQTMESSWGSTSYRYSQDGDLQQITTSRSDQAETVDLERGRVRRIVAFDGGETVFAYHEKGRNADLLREVQYPDGLRLTHIYNDKSSLAEVKVGETRRVQIGRDDHGRIVKYTLMPVDK